MLATGIFRDHKKFSQQYAARFSALMFLLAVVFITTSCGTVAQASGGTSGNSLELSNSLPPGSVSQPYNAVLSVSGGSSPYQFSLASGVLPPGLTLSPTAGNLPASLPRRETIRSRSRSRTARDRARAPRPTRSRSVVAARARSRSASLLPMLL